MIQINGCDIRMEGPLDMICCECGALLLSVADALAAAQEISLRAATETLITGIYVSIPIWEKENRP